MFNSFSNKIHLKELKNFRYLNVVSAIIVTILGFFFEFAYHDGYILISGLTLSMLLTGNYFLSFYSPLFKKYFLTITQITVFLLHFWGVYIAYIRHFEIEVLLPLSVSVFTFSLIFDRFYRSLFFIFSVTTLLLLLMLMSGEWQVSYTVALITLYSGAFLSDQIRKRRSDYRLEIQKQESRYLSVVERMNDGLIYTNEEQRLLFVNDRFCQITGYQTEELIGRWMPELTPGGQNESRILSFMENLQEGQTDSLEEQLLGKNGEFIWVKISGSLYVDENGRRQGAMLVFTDISALKKIQEHLKRREEGYRTFIDQSAVGIWRAEYKHPIPVNLPEQAQIELLLDTGIISECNGFMAQMYGYKNPEELIGRKIRDFYYFENNLDEIKTRDLMTSFIRHNYRISNAESKERDLDGNIRYMLNNNIGVVENGFLVRTWGVQTDITERKRTERELQETNQELDTFFYKASHDLKGPLASVMGIVNLARLERNDPQMQPYFDMIEKSVKRLDRTLMDLIELARTRKGNSKLSSINIKDLLEEIINSLRHLSDFHRINFELKVDHEIEIRADKVLVLSVFQNLIHNAINYCNHQSPWIRIKAERMTQGVRVEIADNGKGIPEHVRDRVFEMFYRGHPDSSGSGLGLFIVKNALDKMKGQIRFETETGKGTTFFVEIPSRTGDS